MNPGERIAKHDRCAPPTTQLRRRLDFLRSRRSVGTVDAAGRPGTGRRCLAYLDSARADPALKEEQDARPTGNARRGGAAHAFVETHAGFQLDRKSVV